MLIVHNARLWTLKRRLDAHERQAAAMAHLAPAAPADPAAPHARTRGPDRDRPEGLAGMRSPIFVAIDTPDLERAKTIAARVRHHVGGIKLGLEFFSANGRAGIREMAELGLPIFLDLKFHDIPNTVAKAIQALRPLEPAILTVHAAGGRAMMEDAKAAAPKGTKVVGVTVLTSLDGSDLASIGFDGRSARPGRRG